MNLQTFWTMTADEQDQIKADNPTQELIFIG